MECLKKFGQLSLDFGCENTVGFDIRLGFSLLELRRSASSLGTPFPRELPVLHKFQGRVLLGHFPEPLPVVILVACLPQVGIALERRPRTVPGVGCDLGDVQAKLEQPRNTVVPQVMKAKVVDSEKLAGARKRRADRVRGVREDLIGDFGHRLNDRKCFLLQIAPHIIADLLTGILHVAHKDAIAVLIEVFPGDPDDLLLPTG